MDKFNNKVSMAIEDWYNVQNDDGDYEFAYGTVDFLSTRPNSHKHIFTEDVIKEYAPSVINKWVIAYYDDLTGDVTTHVKNQHIIGRVPEQEVKYRYDEDGYLIASVDVILSKLYATDVYELFKRYNYRSVSIEELVGFSEDTEMFEDGKQEKKVTGFNITAISVLGLSYRPSVPNANIQLTKMSEMNEENLQNAEKEYIKYSQNKNNTTLNDIMDKLTIIEKKLNKEETMEDNKELKSTETMEEVQADSKAEPEVDEKAEDKVEEMDCGSEEEKMEEQPEEEVDKKADDEDSKDSKDEDSEEEEKEADTKADDSSKEENTMAELEEKLSNAEEKIRKYEAELAELKEFKSSVEMSKKNDIVTQTLSRVKDFLSEQEYAECVKKGESCSYEEIGAWKNETLASIAEKALEKVSSMSSNEKEEGVLDMGIPKENETVKTSIFD